MQGTELDFSFNMEGIDRKALLAQAAEELNALRGHLGPQLFREPGADVPEAMIVRAMMNDDAKFGVFPLVYKISDRDFIHQHRDVPFRFKELAKECNFYWVRIPVQIMPQDNWAYDRLKLHIKMQSEDVPPYLQPRSYLILPEKRFETLLEVSSRLEVSLDSDFGLSAKVVPQQADIGVAQASIGVGVDTKIESDVGLVVGPFLYQMKKAKINHNATGTEEVKWDIKGAEFFQDYDLQIIVIAQVPRAAKTLKVVAAMQAYHYFTFAPARLQQAIKQLSQKIIDFFMGGAPVQAYDSWDLTPLL